MSLRTSAAVKSDLEGLGLSLPVDLDRPAPGRRPDYLVVVELPAALTVEHHGDYGDQAADEACTELVQIDYVHRIRDPAGRIGWDPVVIDRILLHFRAAHLPSSPYHVYGTHIDGVIRRDLTPGTAQTSITIRVRRSLRRL